MYSLKSNVQAYIPAVTLLFCISVSHAASQDLEQRVQRLEQVQQSRQQFDNVNQIIQLQESIEQLRGELEVQSRSLQELSNRQQLFYQDIDARLQTLEESDSGSQPSTQVKSVTPPAASTTVMSTATRSSNTLPVATLNFTADPAPVVPPNNPTASVVGVPADAIQEQAAYQQAYQHLLDQNYPEALTGLNNYLRDYSQGRYRANAYYWLGEVYLIEKQPQQAQQAFNTVVKDYPKNPKAGDALLKLGYAYAALGDTTQAKTILHQVIQDYPNSALTHLAQARLEELGLK